MSVAAVGVVRVYYKADNCYLYLQGAAGLSQAELLQAAATKAGENVEHVFLAFAEGGNMVKLADDADLKALRDATTDNFPSLHLLRRHSAAQAGAGAGSGADGAAAAAILHAIHDLRDQLIRILRPDAIKRAASKMSTEAIVKVLGRLHRSHEFPSIPCACYTGPALQVTEAPDVHVWRGHEDEESEVARAAQWLRKHVAPPGVEVVALTSQKWLHAHWPSANVTVDDSKTDFIFLPRHVADELSKKPSREELIAVLAFALALYEAKTTSKLQEWGLMHMWPQAAAQHLAVNTMAASSTFYIPVFSGDLIQHIVVHSSFDARTGWALHIAQHIKEADARGTARAVAYMRGLLSQNLDRLSRGTGGDSPESSERRSTASKRSKRSRSDGASGDGSTVGGRSCDQDSDAGGSDDMGRQQQPLPATQSCVTPMAEDEDALELHYHRALLNIFARPEGYEAFGLPVPPHTVEHSSVKDWVSSWQVVCNTASFPSDKQQAWQ